MVGLLRGVERGVCRALLGLVANWCLDEAGGTTATDSAGDRHPPH
jgi:hypothetical protein